MNEYIKNKATLYIKCHCGNIYKKNWNRLHNLNQFECNKCANAKMGLRCRTSIDEIKQICSKNGYTLINITKNTCAKNICIQDKQGYKYKTIITNIKTRTNRSSRFSKRNPFQIENMEHYLEINKIGNFAEKPIKNFNTKNTDIKFECIDCHKSFNVKWEQLMSDKRNRCPRCSRRQSNCEYYTEQYLKSIGVEYETEKTFLKCKNKRNLRFDFYLPKYNLVIEVNGSQHYYENDVFEMTLKEQKQRDKMKKQFCIDNKINYIAIPFWDYYNDKYKKQINKILGVD